MNTYQSIAVINTGEYSSNQHRAMPTYAVMSLRPRWSYLRVYMCSQAEKKYTDSQTVIKL